MRQAKLESDTFAHELLSELKSIELSCKLNDNHKQNEQKRLEKFKELQNKRRSLKLKISSVIDKENISENNSLQLLLNDIEKNELNFIEIDSSLKLQEEIMLKKVNIMEKYEKKFNDLIVESDKDKKLKENFLNLKLGTLNILLNNENNENLLINNITIEIQDKLNDFENIKNGSLTINEIKNKWSDKNNNIINDSIINLDDSMTRYLNLYLFA